MSNTYVVKQTSSGNVWDEEVEADSYSVEEGFITFYRRSESSTEINYDPVFTTSDQYVVSVRRGTDSPKTFTRSN